MVSKCHGFLLPLIYSIFDYKLVFALGPFRSWPNNIWIVMLIPQYAFKPVKLWANILASYHGSNHSNNFVLGNSYVETFLSLAICTLYWRSKTNFVNHYADKSATNIKYDYSLYTLEWWISSLISMEIWKILILIDGDSVTF